MRNILLIGYAVVVFTIVTATSTSFAQDQTPLKSDAEPAKSEELTLEQAQIAEQFKRFEQVVKLLAQFSDETDRDQARLLRQVFAESQTRSLDSRFDGLVKALADKRLSQAATDQAGLTADLEELLAILTSAEREQELKNEQNQLREYLKKVKELINRQREVQGRTADGEPREQAADEKKLSEEAKKLAERMAQAEAAKQAKARPGQRPKQEGEPQPNDQKPPGDQKPAESGKPTPPAPPKEGAPPNGKPKDGKPSQGGESQKPCDCPDPQPSDGSPSSSPQKKIESAQKRMEQARKKLEEAERKGALEEQDEAIRELEQAKAELEEILRQLREEELARMLAMLQERFNEMLRMQEAVHRDTLVLHAIPPKTRGKAEQIEAGRLSRDEGLVLVEADKALDLLREEGSAVALPATCELMRDDVAEIVRLLGESYVDELTIGIEEDVITALKEMIEALKKAQKDLKDKKNPPTGEGGDAEPPLVDKIAELKMVRSLQLRVNRRTKLIAETAAKTKNPELLSSLRTLAEREDEVHRITRDIVLGKNK